MLTLVSRYVEQLNSVDDTDPTSVPPLLCLVEQVKDGTGIHERVVVSMIAISASTGDVTWDQFDGTRS